MRATSRNNRKHGPTAWAMRLSGKIDAHGFPSPSAWQKARPLRFDRDWRGRNADPLRATEVRLLWAPEMLYLHFQCQFRTITVFPDARADGWRYELWDRDVAEGFLQPDSSDPWGDSELGVSQNGEWVCL